MKYWLISDTHLGHHNLEDYESRPEDFTIQIINNWNTLVNDNDLIIHLGDVILSGKDNYNRWVTNLRGRKILIKGNHDSGSYKFYLEHGWDFVCEYFVWKIYGLQILFSHKPMIIWSGIDINIHGHSHSRGNFISDKHRLFILEHHYKPIELRTFLKI